jgi:hypothetical protein
VIAEALLLAAAIPSMADEFETTVTLMAKIGSSTSPPQGRISS